MTPGQILTLVKDVLIVCGIGYILWFIHRADQNAVKIVDMQAVMDQIDHNAQTEEKFREEARNAEAQRLVDNQTIVAAVSAHSNEPVRLCNNASGRAVPGTPATPASGAPAAGGSDQRPGEDLRPAISAFEQKWEGYLSQCRSVLASWPQ